MRTCRQLAAGERRKPMTAALAAVRTPGWRADPGWLDGFLAAVPRDLSEHGSCSSRKLTAVARWIEARRRQESDVWVFFDHDPGGAAVQDARALRAHARRRAREEV